MLLASLVMRLLAGNVSPLLIITSSRFWGRMLTFAHVCNHLSIPGSEAKVNLADKYVQGERI